MDWHEYFRRMREERDAAKAVPPEPTSKVLIQGHAIDPGQLPKNIADVAKLLPGVKARHARTWHEGAVFKSGSRIGEKRPDKTIDHYAIAWPGKHALTAVWSDGKMQYAKGWDGEQLFWTESVNELKAKIKEGWTP
jgi:hypothetical protein